MLKGNGLKHHRLLIYIHLNIFCYTELENSHNFGFLILREELSASGSGIEINFHILFIPNCSLLCEMRLKDRGVYGSFTYLHELPLYWYPLDTDVVSMEKR